jgi:hypothetical protein
MTAVPTTKRRSVTFNEEVRCRSFQQRAFLPQDCFYDIFDYQDIMGENQATLDRIHDDKPISNLPTRSYGFANKFFSFKSPNGGVITATVPVSPPWKRRKRKWPNCCTSSVTMPKSLPINVPYRTKWMYMAMTCRRRRKKGLKSKDYANLLLGAAS